jgi:hypothetical protein
LLVTGAATGLQPSFGRYVSLVYDLGSVPGGPTVCEPTVELEGMFVGIWAVDADGKGTLIQVVPQFAIAPLGEIDSISISRHDDQRRLRARGRRRLRSDRRPRRSLGPQS